MDQTTGNLALDPNSQLSGFSGSNTAEMLLILATFAKLSCNEYFVDQNDRTPIGDLCHIYCQFTGVVPIGWTDCTFTA